MTPLPRPAVVPPEHFDRPSKTLMPAQAVPMPAQEELLVPDLIGIVDGSKPCFLIVNSIVTENHSMTCCGCF